jgi:hypothetical protein
MFSLLFAMLLDLTMREVVTDIPHDGAALVTYTIVLIFVGFIWAGSRKGKGTAGPASDDGG